MYKQCVQCDNIFIASNYRKRLCADCLLANKKANEKRFAKLYAQQKRKNLSHKNIITCKKCKKEFVHIKVHLCGAEKTVCDDCRSEYLRIYQKNYIRVKQK